MNLSELKRTVRQALREDKAWSDVTTRALRHGGGRGEAVIRARGAGILAGGPAARAAFQIRDPSLIVKTLVSEGSGVRPGQSVLRVRGPLGSILSAERTALNLLSRLSGIATLTRKFARAVRGTGAPIYDTRKTTPGLRTLEKYAVKTGGGRNHRMDLSSAVLLKDNHLRAMKRSGDSPRECLRRLRKSRFKNKVVEMEAQNLKEVWEAVSAGVDVILLDNLSPVVLKKAMRLITAAREARGGPLPKAEVSGGVTLSNVRRVAALGPDRISVGTITHSAAAMDFNLDIL
jgi:nicotinate-nucleotide pyrophosphorylase (carboxylating)